MRRWKETAKSRITARHIESCLEPLDQSGPMREGLSDMGGTARGGLPPSIKKCRAGWGISATGLPQHVLCERSPGELSAVDTLYD